uniref:Uncharacterized protein n=1 Tax=Anguilla anguilla TaxID=7936 RepID=A0A0E9X8M4_ANGAN
MLLAGAWRFSVESLPILACAIKLFFCFFFVVFCNHGTIILFFISVSIFFICSNCVFLIVTSKIAP